MASAVLPERLEVYLRTVDEELQCLPAADRSEIVRELRSHVLDRVEGNLTDASIGATLAMLGDPRELARINLRTRLADHATSPKGARTLSRLATLGGKGLLALILSLAGYAFAGCWLLTALAKPFAPDRVGLWLLPDPTGDLSLSLGRHAVGVAAHDILGWWIIPVGLAVGVACAILTYRLDLRLVRDLRRSQSTATSSPA